MNKLKFIVKNYSKYVDDPYVLKMKLRKVAREKCKELYFKHLNDPNALVYKMGLDYTIGQFLFGLPAKWKGIYGQVVDEDTETIYIYFDERISLLGDKFEKLAEELLECALNHLKNELKGKKENNKDESKKDKNNEK